MTDSAVIQIISVTIGALIPGIVTIIVELLKKKPPHHQESNKPKPSQWPKQIAMMLIGGILGYCAGWVINANTHSVLIGKLSGYPNPFTVYPDYSPSGFMGDIGDIKSPVKGSASVSFEYEACGRGLHEWEYKYIGSELNNQPAKFAGVAYIMSNQWWLTPKSGTDLRGFRLVRWEGRSLQGEANVEFIIGGMTWIWDQNNKVIQDALYPDSMPHDSLGIYTLRQTWQEFQVILTDHPEKDFQYVVGGFAWVIDLGSNGVELENPGTCPPQPKVFQIEIRNIRYEK